MENMIESAVVLLIKRLIKPSLKNYPNGLVYKCLTWIKMVLLSFILGHYHKSIISAVESLIGRVA
jgi:hypothetical protein